MISVPPFVFSRTEAQEVIAQLDGSWKPLAPYRGGRGVDSPLD
ncbi:MAG: hypothetical protein U1F12_04235 [Pseudomonadales bacterium]